MRVTRTAFLFFFFLSAVFSFSQVTIGSKSQPVDGALLDLREFDSSEPGGANSFRGLALPRVHILSEKDLFTFGVAEADKEKHVALLVYNTNECMQGIGEDKGLYVWDGKEWMLIGGVPYEKDPTVGIFIDSRDGEEYYYSSFGTAGTWMLENMRAREYDSEAIFAKAMAEKPSLGASFVDPIWSYPNDKTSGAPDPSLYERAPSVGLIYNWFAATGGQKDMSYTADENSMEYSDTHKPLQGICPNGWRLPSDQEWNDLENELIENTSKYSHLSDLKDFVVDGQHSSTGWRGTHSAAFISHCTFVENGKSDFGKGFPIKFGGFVVHMLGYGREGKTFEFGERTYIWTSSNERSVAGWYRVFDKTMVGVGKGRLTLKHDLYSVRCKRVDN